MFGECTMYFLLFFILNFYHMLGGRPLCILDYKVFPCVADKSGYIATQDKRIIAGGTKLSLGSLLFLSLDGAGYLAGF